jgi:hypothetical protein
MKEINLSGWIKVPRSQLSRRRESLLTSDFSINSTFSKAM